MPTYSISNDRSPGFLNRLTSSVSQSFKTASITMGKSLNLFNVSSSRDEAPVKGLQYKRNMSFRCRAFPGQEKRICVAEAVRTPIGKTDEVAHRLHDRLALKKDAALHIIGQYAKKDAAAAETVRKKLEDWWSGISESGLDIKHAQALNKEMMRMLEPLAGGWNPGKAMKSQMAKALVTVLNKRKWPVIETKIAHQDQDALYTSAMTPASQMRTPDGALLFPSYSGTGRCAHTTDEAMHAVNLWTTELRADPRKGELDGEGKGKLLFRGQRHAGLSAFGLPAGSPERAAATLNRAREVAIAALFMGPEKSRLATEGKPVELRLSSTSMLTPMNFGKFSEGTQLDDQLKAWRTLSESPVSFDVTRDGIAKTVKFTVKVAAFNFGVNEGAYKLNLGWSAAKEQNQASLEKLIGNTQPYSHIGGWAREYLSQHPEKNKVIEELVNQIRILWSANDERSYRRDGGDPYKMVTRIAILSQLIDVAPCFNCKSGKDRTGSADTEIKHAATVLHETGQFPQPGMLSPGQKELYREVLLNSGNLELQEANTGSPGNLVLRGSPLGDLSIPERIGDPATAKRIAGYSWVPYLL
ncbi:MAG: Type secretion system outer rane [Herbaspirillum sp.]|nr:Type secretion system outer rane [Herbaspirillum sp.]